MNGPNNRTGSGPDGADPDGFDPADLDRGGLDRGHPSEANPGKADPDEPNPDSGDFDSGDFDFGSGDFEAGDADGDAEMDSGDYEVIDAIHALCQAADPVPRELYVRVRFALDLDGVERELAKICAGLDVSAVRGPEHTRTITFECGRLTIAITITPTGTNRHRVDGWLAPAGCLLVELRSAHLRSQIVSDDCGRFAFNDVGSGEMQLAALPTPGSVIDLDRAVVTQPIVL